MSSALLLAGGAPNAAQMYKWVDKDGKVHYTQTPPPSTAAASVKSVSIAAPVPDPTTLGNTQNLVKATSEQDKKNQEAANKAAQDAQKKQEQQKQCDAARQQLQSFQDTRRIAIPDKDGNPQYYSGDDKLKQEQQLQDLITKNCSGT
jgi:hypothetical protein